MYSPPPVVRRSEMAGTPARVRHTGRNRKRYDVALAIPGAEVRLPSLPALHFSWRILSFLMVLSLAAGLYMLYSLPEFRISTIQVKGLDRIKQSDVETVLALSGESIFIANPVQIRQDLQMAFPEMSSITVTVGLPAIVNIGVIERKPVLTWNQDGHEYWVDSQGVAFPPRGEVADLVAVAGKLPSSAAPDGKSPVQVMEPSLVKAILAISAQAPKKAQLIYDGEHGLGWEDAHGWKVYFGMHVDDIDMKLQVYKTLVKQLNKEEIKPVFVSVEYVHAPYYRVER